MFSVLLILIVSFLPETLYPRGTMLSLGAGALAAEKIDLNTITIKRTRQLPFVVNLGFNEINSSRTLVLCLGYTIPNRGILSSALLKCGHTRRSSLRSSAIASSSIGGSSHFSPCSRWHIPILDPTYEAC